jgi:hypothetical protein|tara:strand:+ start:4227 stop:4697 length:471 start_codon:yes stop_codon:yes gene_type:complete
MVPDSHINMAPDKKTIQYDIDSLSNKPFPPSNIRRASPPIKKTKRKSKAPQLDINNACHNNSSALFLSPAPRLLAMDEVIAPPKAPKAICCVNISTGKARATAASEVVPSSLMNQTSVRTTMACIKNAMVFGADILTSKGKIGSLRNSSVLLSIGV